MKRTICTILVSLALMGCESKEEREARIERARNFALQQTCVPKHGSPVMKDGKFKSCDFRWKGIFSHEKS